MGEHLQTASTCRQAQLDRQTTEQSRFKASLQRHQQLHTQLQEQILNLSRAHELEEQRQLNQLDQQREKPEDHIPALVQQLREDTMRQIGKLALRIEMPRQK